MPGFQLKNNLSQPRARTQQETSTQTSLSLRLILSWDQSVARGYKQCRAHFPAGDACSSVQKVYAQWQGAVGAWMGQG